jgi:hypothetical protein
LERLPALSTSTSPTLTPLCSKQNDANAELVTLADTVVSPNSST